MAAVRSTPMLLLAQIRAGMTTGDGSAAGCEQHAEDGKRDEREDDHRVSLRIVA
jgi:hypothetical protein